MQRHTVLLTVTRFITYRTGTLLYLKESENRGWVKRWGEEGEDKGGKGEAEGIGGGGGEGRARVRREGRRGKKEKMRRRRSVRSRS